MSVGRRGGFLGEGGVHFSQMGPNADVRRGPEKEGGSAPGFAACRPVVHSQLFRQPIPSDSCLLLVPTKHGQDTGVSRPQPAQQHFPTAGAAGLTLPQQTPSSPKRDQEKLYLTGLSCPLRRQPVPWLSTLLTQGSGGPCCAPCPPGRPWASRSLQHPAPAALCSQAPAPSSPTAGADHAEAVY